jgi:hypothetical protein
VKSTTQISHDGFRWTVTPSERDRLLGPDGLRLAEWLRSGQARLVKQGPHRAVYRICLPGLTCYLKHNRLWNLRAWLRQLFRPAKSRIEYDKARAIARRGVATIEPLAVGERPLPGESYLVTRSLDDAPPLDRFLEQPLSPTLRQQLARDLGAFVADMHEAGVCHDDLHPGNLLVRCHDDCPEFFLIDLHAVRLGRTLTWPAARANLVLLNRWFQLRAHRSDRLRFWYAYIRRRPTLACLNHAEGVRDLENHTWASNIAFWRQRDARCLGSNKYFRRLRTARVSGHAIRDIDDKALATLLADPDVPFHRPGVRLLKDSRSSTVAELTIPHEGRMRQVIYKRFRVTSWSDPLVSVFRRTAALRSWIFGHGLRERMLPTARPLAVFHRRRLGLIRESYLLTEKVPEAVDLLAHVNALGRSSPEERRRTLRQLVEQTARLVRDLHDRRLSQRDLKAANILVSMPDSAGPPSLWLIDLVGVRRHVRLPRARRVKDLARLHASFLHHTHVSATDKLRFLRVYLRLGLSRDRRWRRWWYEVAQATQDKVDRNIRSGRPLA